MKQAGQVLIVLLMVSSAATSGVSIVGSASAATPTLDTNTAVEVQEGSIGTQISGAELNSSDSDGDTITYTVTSAVSNGTLFLDGSEGGSTDGTLDGEQPIGTGSFTQIDVDEGQLYYNHDGSESTGENFVFEVSDGNGSAVIDNHFDITVLPSDDPPTLSTSPEDTAYSAGGVVVDGSLTVADPDGGSIDGATVEFGSSFETGVDTLAVNDTVASNTNITNADFDNTTGVLTLDGAASAGEMQAVLRSIIYTYTGEDLDSARSLETTFALGTGSGDGSARTTAQTTVTVDADTAAPTTTQVSATSATGTATPKVSIDRPAADATHATSDVALEASADASGNWTYSVDDGANQTATGANGTQTLNVTLSGLADGSHTATVSINDDGGNVSTDTVNFSIDTTLQDLVQNGGFENSSNNFASGGFKTLDTGTDAITGWRVSSGEVDQVGSWTSQDGSVSIDLSGSEPGAIEQNIAGLQVGEDYVLTYYYTGQPDHGGEYEAVVEIANLDITEAASSSNSASSPGWTLATHNFTAGNTTETLTFTQGATPQDNAGLAIDNVSIVESSDSIDTAAPAPSIDQPAEDATLTGSNVALNVSTNESGNWTYSVDGGANETAPGANGTQTLNVTLSGLAGGSHTATVYIEDDRGNVGMARLNFSVAAELELSSSPSDSKYAVPGQEFVIDDELDVTGTGAEQVNAATVSFWDYNSTSDGLWVDEGRRCCERSPTPIPAGRRPRPGISTCRSAWRSLAVTCPPRRQRK
jgi:choice-of-anchor C domain-containing protein